MKKATKTAYKRKLIEMAIGVGRKVIAENWLFLPTKTISYNMRNIFAVAKFKWLVCCVATVFVTSFLICFFNISQTAIPKPQYTIVIDAGHGGRDGGAVGQSGVSESRLNLDYALTLKEIACQFGFGVVLTRENMGGLYDENAENKKRSEMEKRRQIINQSGADLLVSLHMNSFPLRACRGAYVFYKKGSNSGLHLAESVQKSLCQSIDYARETVSVGDYFVLNYSQIPAVLVECGFVSNEEEEKLLLSESYRQKFCYALFAGVMNYFEMN